MLIRQDYDMNLEDIKKTIAKRGESGTVELKKSTANLKSAAQTLCAFLNGKGGTVFIGIGNDHKVIGQVVNDKTKLDISNTLKKLEPTANIEIEYIDVEKGRQVITMTAHPDGHCVPYSFSGCAYERQQADTHTMSQTRYQQLLLTRNISPVSWESLPADDFNIDGLDHNEIIDTVKDGIQKYQLNPSFDGKSIEYILTKFNLLQDDKLIQAAPVLFGTNLGHGYIQCIIRMARFKGLEKGTFIDKKHVIGNAFTLLREAENFISRNTAVAVRIVEGQMQRVEEQEYPFKAVREALINALCHRDYSSPGGSITLVIYDDRLELINTGLLPKGITIDQLKEVHSSHPRNPYITDVFNKRGLIEAMGMGTQQIINICAQEGMKEPEFFEQTGTFGVRLWSRSYSPARLTSEEPEVTDRQKKILSLLEAGTKAPNELLNVLDEDITDRTLRRDLQTLKEMGYIDAEGAGGWARRWFLIKK